jgi:hypothetical protein
MATVETLANALAALQSAHEKARSAERRVQDVQSLDVSEDDLFGPGAHDDLVQEAQFALRRAQAALQAAEGKKREVLVALQSAWDAALPETKSPQEEGSGWQFCSELPGVIYHPKIGAFTAIQKGDTLPLEQWIRIPTS